MIILFTVPTGSGKTDTQQELGSMLKVQGDYDEVFADDRRVKVN